MIRVSVNPDVLRWARERAGFSRESLAAKFKKLPEWEDGKTRPTLKQLEAFARAVHAPVGYLFLSEPLEEPIPIPDFRTFSGKAAARPSLELLQTIYMCQERQSWYRNFARVAQQPELAFVGSVKAEMAPEDVAIQMREALGFNPASDRVPDTLRLLTAQAEKAGVLVMVSGTVTGSSHRRLNPSEFSGFALSNPLAPLIFLNGNDRKAAQMLTLAHELAHIWLGKSGLSNVEMAPSRGSRHEEIWCNAVAIELLVPLADFCIQLRDDEALDSALSRLKKVFKVSTQILLRRLLDAGWLDQAAFDAAWNEVSQSQMRPKDRSAGGNSCRTTLSRVGHRFARAVMVSTLEGQTLYRDAFRMLDVSGTEMFNNLAREAGMIA